VRLWRNYFQDNYNANTLQLVIYDGWLLDEMVEAKIGNFNWVLKVLQFLPKPDVVVFLDGGEEASSQGKANLLKLAEAGLVDAIIGVNNRPGPVALEIKNLFLDALIRKHGK